MRYSEQETITDAAFINLRGIHKLDCWQADAAFKIHTRHEWLQPDVQPTWDSHIQHDYCRQDTIINVLGFTHT